MNFSLILILAAPTPCVTGLKDGNFVVISASYGQDGSSSGIYGQRFKIKENQAPVLDTS